MDLKIGDYVMSIWETEHAERFYGVGCVIDILPPRNGNNSPVYRVKSPVGTYPWYLHELLRVCNSCHKLQECHTGAGSRVMDLKVGDLVRTVYASNTSIGRIKEASRLSYTGIPRWKVSGLSGGALWGSDELIRICKNCRKPIESHLNNRCLFGPGNWE